MVIMLIKMLSRLKRRVGELRENFSKERKYKKNQSELKNTIKYEKYMRGNQLQIRGCRRIDQQYERQGNGKLKSKQKKIILKNVDKL